MTVLQSLMLNLRKPSVSVIGIPRALMFHRYAQDWVSFFTALGCQPMVSIDSNESILRLGNAHSVSELCLPVKLFLGHVASLAQSCEAVFVPALISASPDCYFCPLFLGLPDIVRNSIPKLPRLIDAHFNAKLDPDWRQGYEEAGRLAGYNREVSSRAFTALDAASNHEALLPPQVLSERVVVGVIGHPYLLQDRFINHDLFSWLAQAGVSVLGEEQTTDARRGKAMASLARPIYWNSGRDLVGTGFALLEDKLVDGLILVTAFGCGPDSLLAEVLARYAEPLRVPVLKLMLDEHITQVGIHTRLEAFLDILERRKRVRSKG